MDGFAPYGYQLIDGELQINEEEAAAIRVIYDQYVNTDIGSNGIAKYLENHGIRKIQTAEWQEPFVRCSFNSLDSKKSSVLWENRLWTQKNRKSSWNQKRLSSC